MKKEASVGDTDRHVEMQCREMKGLTFYEEKCNEKEAISHTPVENFKEKIDTL